MDEKEKLPEREHRFFWLWLEKKHPLAYKTIWFLVLGMAVVALTLSIISLVQ